MRKRYLFSFSIILCLILALGSCGSIKKFTYFQDINPNDTLGIYKPHAITFEPGDRLSIVVSSKDPKLAALFNLPTVAYRVGEASGSMTGSYGATGQLATYTVDTKGNIDFPVLGTIHLEGLTREEVSGLIKGMLIGRDLLKDPVVTVEYGNIYYYTLGEIGQGKHAIDRENLNLIDAVSENGGLSNYGLRDSVMVIRQENGIKKVYNVDFTDYKSIASSPAYYVKQNDIIYVKPNNTKKRQSTANGNTFITPSFWMSIASLLTSIAVLVFK